MKLSFIDEVSWKCMLGPRSKNILITPEYAKWEVNEKTHIVRFKPIKSGVLDSFSPFSFHYFSLEDLSNLNNHRIEKSKVPSVYLELEKTFSMSGKSFRGIRNKINRCEKLDLEVLDNYKDIKDVKKFVGLWSDIFSYKYYMDFSGKNLHFYSNNFHEGCINSFIYYKGDLVAYGTISPPVEGNSAYVIGKAFYKYDDGVHKYDGIIGLSEFLDIDLYKKAYSIGCRFISMGRSSTKNLLTYKKKFNGSVEFNEYDGKIL